MVAAERIPTELAHSRLSVSFSYMHFLHNQQLGQAASAGSLFALEFVLPFCNLFVRSVCEFPCGTITTYCTVWQSLAESGRDVEFTATHDWTFNEQKCSPRRTLSLIQLAGSAESWQRYLPAKVGINEDI